MWINMKQRPGLMFLTGFGIVFAVAVIEGVLLFGNVDPIIMAISFKISRTSNPMALIDQRVPPAARFGYGDEDLQFGELRVPKGEGPFPVAIVVHGGCWVARLPGLLPAVTSLDLMRPLTLALEREGIATWNVEYRRLQNAGGGWPGTYFDLGKSADYLRNLASKHPLDLARVIVIGHSAGGHLALWLAARAKLPDTSELYSPSPLPIAGVIDIDGPPDLQTVPAGMDETACGAPVIRRFLGGPLSVLPVRYREGSAGGLLPLRVRQELVVASKNEFMKDDEQAWAQLFTSYAVSAKDQGDAVNTTFLRSGGHFDGIDPASSSWAQVNELIISLVKKP